MLLTKHERRTRFWRNFLFLQVLVSCAIWKVIPELFELSGIYQIILGALTILAYVSNKRKVGRLEQTGEENPQKLYALEWHTPTGIQQFKFRGPAQVEGLTVSFVDLETKAETIVTGSFRIIEIVDDLMG